MEYGRTFPTFQLPGHTLKDDYRAALDKHGCVLVREASMPTSKLIELASTLGTPLKESPAVDASYVEQEVVLNIRTDRSEGITMDNEPFSVHALRMHMERAYSTQATQPNYIVFLCIEAPEEENGGQTLLLSMKDFATSFTNNDLDLMRQMRPRTSDRRTVSPNPILAYDAARDISYFSYRDLGSFGADWDVAEEPASHARLDGLARKLTAALYAPENLRALSWQPGNLYIIDNKKYFHGRTEQKKASHRHLKRIRIV